MMRFTVTILSTKKAQYNTSFLKSKFAFELYTPTSYFSEAIMQILPRILELKTKKQQSDTRFKSFII
ncbi:hypothetical protein V7597_16120 [Bacillus toyonensis]